MSPISLSKKLNGRHRQMEADPLPDWIARRLHVITRLGSMSLLRERKTDLIAFRHPVFSRYRQILKTLDLTETPILSLEGLPELPQLTSLVLDRTSLSSLKNVATVCSIRSISLKKTPLSELPHFKLSIILGLGPNLIKIDDCVLTDLLKGRANDYPSCTHALINTGWIAEYPCPPSGQLAVLCEEYGVTKSVSVASAGCAELGVEEPVALPDSFDGLAAALMKQHEQMILEKQALFGIMEDVAEENEFVDLCRVRIGNLFRDQGVAVDVNNDAAILEAIDQLCRRPRGR
jgi:Leucine-rich repeat (LRR) protein